MTQTATHTPGPWYWSEDPWHGGYTGLYSENGMPVVIPQHENDGDDGAAWFDTGGDACEETLTESDASLVAAAPDLLAALKELVASEGPVVTEADAQRRLKAVRAAEDAIAKAEGGDS